MYTRKEINNVDGIPVFSEHDFYIENYDRISQDHIDHFNKTGKNPFMNELYWSEIEKSTERIIRRNIGTHHNKILDVGVGMGRMLEKFPDLDRYGVDISIEYLKIARNKGINVIMSKIEELPYEDNFFDVIVTTDVLEHVLDLNLSLAKIISVLRKDGLLVIRVPFKEDLEGYLDPQYPYEYVHLRNFDLYSMRLIIEKVFKLKFVDYSLAGHLGADIKFFSRRSLMNHILKFGLRVLFKAKPSWGHSISLKLCRPVEINYVFSK